MAKLHRTQKIKFLSCRTRRNKKGSIESAMVGKVGRIQRWPTGFQPVVYKHTFTQLFNQILFWVGYKRILQM